MSLNILKMVGIVYSEKTDINIKSMVINFYICKYIYNNIKTEIIFVHKKCWLKKIYQVLKNIIFYDFCNE